MAAFTTPLDIANRACQHLGVPRIISPNTLAAPLNKQAREIAFAIDMVRRAELRRAVWTFATRKAVLRKWTATTRVVTFAAWAVGTTYAAGNIVADSTGYLWISTVGSNTGHVPGLAGAPPWWISYFGPTVADVWASTTAAAPYFPGDVAYTSTVAYILLGLATTTTAAPASGAPWVAITGATVAAPINFAPIAFDPPTGAGVDEARNLYRLPANHMRVAAQDPKTERSTVSGTTAGMRSNDFEIQAGYLTTKIDSPIIYRFCADQTDITAMDDLFCEIWAASLAMELNQTINQSQEKLASITARQLRYLETAKLINAIEQGSDEPVIPEGGEPVAPAQGGR